MLKTRARKVSVILFAVIMAVLIAFFLLNSFSVSPAGESNTDKVSSQETDALEQKAAGVTAGIAFSVVSDALYAQLPEELGNEVVVANNQLNEDPETGEPLWLAVVSLSNISATLDVDKHVQTVADTITDPEVTGSPAWTYELVDDPEVLNTDSGIIKSLTVWEDNSNPVNPAIINFAYYLVTDEDSGEEFYEITIQAAVVPGSAVPVY